MNVMAEVISMPDLGENARLPSCEDDTGGFLQRGFSGLVSVAREREEQLAERWVRLPTGTSGTPNRASECQMAGVWDAKKAEITGMTGRC